MQISVKKALKFWMAIGFSLTVKRTEISGCSSERMDEKKLAVFLNLDSIAESIIDKVPDKRECYLPFFQKRHVYEHFCEENKTVYQ